MLGNLMNQTVNVSRPTPTKGTSGAEKDTYTTVYTGLTCSVQPTTATWMIQYSRRAIDVSHSLYFNTNPTIRNGDKILFGSRVFLVKGIRDLISLGKVLVVDVLEII